MILGPIQNENMGEGHFKNFYLEDVERFDRDNILCIWSVPPSYILPEYLIYFQDAENVYGHIVPIPGFYLYRSKYAYRAD
jgi:hypothetical protein